MSDKLDHDIDRGWFAPDLTASPGGSPVAAAPAGALALDEPAPPRPPESSASTLSDAEWERLVDTLRTYEREVAALVNPRRRAALCYEIGRIYETRLADERRAVIAYQRAHRADPFHLPTLRAGRGVFARAGRWAMVLNLVDAELRADPTPSGRARLLVEKGDVYLRCDEPALAKTCYEAALELAPENRAGLRALARLAGGEGDAARLSACLERQAAQIHDPAFAVRLLCDAASVRIAHRPTDEHAVELLEAARRLAPEDTEILDLLARAHRRAGRWAALIALWESTPHCFEASMSRAERLTETARLIADRLNDTPRAVALLEQALQIDPFCVSALELLAELQEREGHHAAAIGSLSRLCGQTREPAGRARLLGKVADLQLRLGDEEGAIASLGRLLDVTPDDAPALELLGRLLARRGEWGALLSAHEAELGRLQGEGASRARADKLFKMGELAEHRLGDSARAARCYAEAVALTPGFLHATHALLRVLRRGGDVEALAAALAAEAARAQAPEERLVALEELGELQAGALNLPEKALETWRAILALRIEHSAARRHVVRLTERLGLHAEHLSALDGEIESTRDEARMLTLLVQAGEVAERALQDRARARAYFERALALSPRYVPALQGMGRLLQAEGGFAALVEMYQREIEVSRAPADAIRLHFKIAATRRTHLGDSEGAIRAYEQVLELAPGNTAAVRALQTLFAERGDVAREAEMFALEVEITADPIEQGALLCRLGALYQHRMGKADLAAEAYLRAASLHASAERSLLPLIALQEERGDDHEVVAALRRLAEARSEPGAAADAWVQAGRLYAERLKLDVEAIECCERALSLTPDEPHVGALLQLERLYRASRAPDDLARVLGRLAEAVRAPEDRLEYSVARARVLSDFGDEPMQAEAAWLDVLALEAGHLEALDRLDASRSLRRDFEGLLDVLERRLHVTHDARDQVALHLRRGELLRAVGRDFDAATALEAGVRIDPTSLPVARALREVCADIGRGEDALRLTEVEARLSNDLDAAASLFLSAARTRESRLNDLEGAFQDFAQALERQPANDEASLGIQRVGERLGRHADVVRMLERRAQATPERAPEMLLEAAGLYVRRLGSPDQAVRALNLALRQAPQQTPLILQRLADLYAEQEDWSEAAAVYEQLRDVSEDPELRRAVGFRLAAIFEEKQPDMARARGCLQQILREFPADADAWLRLSRLCEATGDRAGVLDALRSALRVVESPEGQAEIWERIGRAEEGRGNVEAALASFEAVLALRPTHAEVAIRLAELRAARGEIGALVATLSPVLAALQAEGGEAAAALRRRAAELVLPHDREGALAELELLIAENPDDDAARRLLATSLEASAGDAERAVPHLLHLAARDPFDVSRVQALREAAAVAGQLDLGWQLALWLSALGAARPSDLAFLRECRERVARWPDRPLDAAMRLRLRSPREVPMLDELLGAVARALPRFFAAPPTVPTRDVNTAELEQSARRCGRILGVEDVRVLTDRTLGDGVRYTDNLPPMLIFGAGAVENQGAGEHIFHLARGIELGRRRIAGVLTWEWRSLRTLLETVCCLDGGLPPDTFATADELAQRLEQLEGLMDARARKTLVERLPEIRRLLPGLDLASALAAWEESANRVALLAAGSLVPAVSVLRRVMSEPTEGTLPERLASNAPLRTLARWIFEPEYLAIRAELGLAPSP